MLLLLQAVVVLETSMMEFHVRTDTVVVGASGR